MGNRAVGHFLPPYADSAERLSIGNLFRWVIDERSRLVRVASERTRAMHAASGPQRAERARETGKTIGDRRDRLAARLERIRLEWAGAQPYLQQQPISKRLLSAALVPYLVVKR